MAGNENSAKDFVQSQQSNNLDGILRTEAIDAVNSGLVKNEFTNTSKILKEAASKTQLPNLQLVTPSDVDNEEADAGDGYTSTVIKTGKKQVVNAKKLKKYYQQKNQIEQKNTKTVNQNKNVSQQHTATAKSGNTINKSSTANKATTTGTKTAAKTGTKTAAKTGAKAGSKVGGGVVKGTKYTAMATADVVHKVITFPIVIVKSLISALSAIVATIGPVLPIILAIVLFIIFLGVYQQQSENALDGLPPYITEEMVVTALECQEKYGHPAGCTIAQIICESGKGDTLSGLALKDNNLFGIKWASRFAVEPEVKGCADYSTQEYYGDGATTIVAQFTSFNSYKDCIVFRSRVFLQASRYADNELIKQAIAEKSSDKMAEGLKDAGYATSPSYVESLKTCMEKYNLYRFDGMSVEEFYASQQGGSSSNNGNTIVDAAYSQIGTPYVWGGSTPNVALDCSGLVQYCYAQAGISLPHSSSEQAAGGTSVPLSEAQPGDILYKVGHVAIYIGGDEYIHAPQPGQTVCKATGINYFTCAVRY